MGLKKAESQVKVLLGDTIVALCRNTLNFHAEISVEGLLGITLDNEEIFLVNINQTIKNPDAPANQDKDDGHKRRATSNDRHGKSSSDDSSTDDSDDSTPRRKRRRRNRKKRRSGAPSDGDAVDGSFSKHSAQDNTRRSNESRVTHSDTGQCTQSVPPDVAQSANHSNVTQSVVSHSNVLQSPDLHPNVGQSTSCQSHVSPSASSGQANNSQSGNSTADNDTGQNGVVSVKQEVMSDDENQDEDLIIVKEEIGDAEHPNPVLLFPNVSQTLQQSDPFLTGAPQTSLPQSFMSSTSQSLPSSSPVPGPSNMCPTSALWHSRSNEPVEGKRRPNDPGPLFVDDFQTNVQIKLDLLLSMVGDLQQNMILGSGAPEQVDDILDGPCTSVAEVEEFSRRLECDSLLRQRVTQSLVSLGGHNAKDYVRRMVRRLGTDELWSQYSLYGRKGKRPFKDLALCRIITQASLQVNNDAKVSDIEELISDTLRQAPFRGGARKAKIPEVAMQIL